MRIACALLVLLSSVAGAEEAAGTAAATAAPPPATVAPPPAPVVPPPVAAPPPRVSHTPYQLRLDLDLPLLILGATLWGGTSFVGSGAPPPWCGSSTTPACDPNTVNAFDRLAIGYNSDKARLGANILVGLVPGAFVILDVVDAGVTHWKSWLTDAVVILEGVVWSGAIQDVVRRAVRRPRPYMYTPGLNPGGRDGPEADFSFFSGHTSNLFAMVTATAFTYTLRHPHSKWNWLVWSLAVAGESVEPILRSYAGDHFPTDCIVGALVGTSVGILFPVLHKKRVPLRFTSSSGPDGTFAGVAGAF